MAILFISTREQSHETFLLGFHGRESRFSHNMAPRCLSGTFSMNRLMAWLARARCARACHEQLDTIDPGAIRPWNRTAKNCFLFEMSMRKFFRRWMTLSIVVAFVAIGSGLYFNTVADWVPDFHCACHEQPDSTSRSITHGKRHVILYMIDESIR